MKGDRVTENDKRKYRQTLQLGLIKTVRELFPEERIKISYSILDGEYCEFVGSLASPREVRQIESRLKNWVKQNSSLKFLDHEGGFYRYDLEGTVYQTIYPAFSNTSKIKEFHLIPFAPGFILYYAGNSEALDHFLPPQKLSATYFETQRWLENLGLDEVKDVNAYIRNGRSMELIGIAEALQEKKIGDIADRILLDKKNVRIVLVSGPSSSGKTTFAQRLSTQLRVNGLKPVPLSLDNYFLNRENTPRDSSGKPDFDTLQALDLALLNEHVVKLVRGEPVVSPVFSFLTGTRSPSGQTLKLSDGEILVIEGLHALNPGLFPGLNRNYFYKIYVSALFLLNINSYNRIPTTEARLIRRIVRDDKFRGLEPKETLGRWGSVRRGESANIFAYQEEADIMFNSSLLYELNALRSFAEPLMNKFSKECPQRAEMSRLLNLLYFFEPMDTEKVPFNSILREFIGGSLYA